MILVVFFLIFSNVSSLDTLENLRFHECKYVQEELHEGTMFFKSTSKVNVYVIT